jgi:hypothetical protein
MRWVACATLCLAVIVPARGEDGKSTTKAEPSKARMVPQYGWQPRAGDTANIVSPDGSPMKIALNTIDDRLLRYLVGSKDWVRVRAMVEAGRVIEVPNMAPVVVIDVGEISTTHRTAEVARGSRSVMGRVADQTVRSWNVRLTDGKHKGASVIVPVERLEHFVRVQEKVKPRPKTFQGGTPAARASQAYRDARKLEGEGKYPEAIKVYRELSGSIFPEAKLAAERLKVLTGK